QRGRAGMAAGLREAGGGLSREGPPGHPAGGDASGPGDGARDAGSGRDGHDRVAGGGGLPDGAGRRVPAGDGPGARGRRVGGSRAEGPGMNGDGTRHILSILVENRFGELCRVVGLFSGRGYNIDSLGVAPTSDPAYSRIILTTNGNDVVIEQILKQVGKLVRVLEVVDLNGVNHVEREMALLIVSTGTPAERQEVLNLAAVFRAKVIDISTDAVTL